MQLNTIINSLFFAFACVGAIDYLLDNRFGLGIEFERGINCTGKLIICMVGFMTLAPVIGRVLSPLATPFFVSIGADPSVMAGMLLANDSGGAVLAMELALDQQAGAFNGYVVASMLGGTVMCIIPMTMLNTDTRVRPAAIYGLVIGLFCVPFGSMVGGLAAGFSVNMLWHNLVPVIGLTFVLFVSLLLFQRWIIKPFQFFGKLLVGVSLTGLLLTAAHETLGLTLVEGMQPFSEVIPIIGNIALILCGVFPLLAVVTRLLRGVIHRCASALKIGEQDTLSFLVTAVNLFPTFEHLNHMSLKGVMMNIAFMVGANCIIGDHFAFTFQMAPNMVGPMLIAKSITGGLALVVSAALAPRLLGKEQRHSEDAPCDAPERSGRQTATG